ncbi:hypothetical protein GCM10009535_13550 [Streptomyces thermocarboxydovorans]|uniref:Uncharacterized protein n=1 Tax=Streptomyces thermocarboxydovorans TaxID=59298 RepID=A0ABN1HCP6_9ACTN
MLGEDLSLVVLRNTLRVRVIPLTGRPPGRPSVTHPAGVRAGPTRWFCPAMTRAGDCQAARPVFTWVGTFRDPPSRRCTPWQTPPRG